MLEPTAEVNPYRGWITPRTPIDRDIRSLYEIGEPQKLEQRTTDC